jgi:hypothetical protein
MTAPPSGPRRERVVLRACLAREAITLALAAVGGVVALLAFVSMGRGFLLATAALALATVAVLVRGWRPAVVDAVGVTLPGARGRHVAWQDVRAIAVVPFPVRPRSPARIEVFLTTGRGVVRFDVHTPSEARAVAELLEACAPPTVAQRIALRAAVGRAFGEGRARPSP